MTTPQTSAAPPTAPTAYQVGVFALVQQRDTYLIVRPVRPLLPGGAHGLPGLTLTALNGTNIVEQNLRRALLSQVGIAVSDLRLVGSHAARTSTDITADQAGAGQPGFGQPSSRLNLIFGTEYCSGILNPQPEHFHSAEWVSRAHLAEAGGVPEWLQGAVRAFETTTLPPSAASALKSAAPISRLPWRRR